MIFDSIEWDENNLDHAYRRVTGVEIEEVIADGTSYHQHRRHADRITFIDHTNGCKRVTVVAHYDAGRHLVRPITAWEES